MGSKDIVLDEVITDIAAGPFGSNLKVSCFVEKGFPIIDGANLKGFKVTDNLTKFVTEEKARSLSRSIAKRGDVVVTISGTLGQIAYVPDNSAYPEYLCSQRQFRVSFDQSRVYVPYLVFYFHTKEGQSKILAFSNQTGVPALSQPTKNFRNIKLSLPSLVEQRRIARIGELLNKKIELNQQINDYLEQLLLARFDHMFQTSDSYNGTIADIGDVVGGATPSKKKPEYYCHQGIGWITPKDLSSTNDKFIAHGADDITQAGFNSCSVKKLPAGSVLFSSRAPIGYIAIATEDVTTNQGFKSVVPHAEVGTAFVYCFLKLNKDRIADAGSGTTFPEVSGKTMANIELTLPDVSLCTEFEEWSKPILYEQHRLEEENRSLGNLRDALLPKLMPGEIDVSKIEVPTLPNNHLSAGSE